jgi:hypothetical protein
MAHQAGRVLLRRELEVRVGRQLRRREVGELGHGDGEHALEDDACAARPFLVARRRRVANEKRLHREKARVRVASARSRLERVERRRRDLERLPLGRVVARIGVEELAPLRVGEPVDDGRVGIDEPVVGRHELGDRQVVANDVLDELERLSCDSVDRAIVDLGRARRRIGVHAPAAAHRGRVAAAVHVGRRAERQEVALAREVTQLLEQVVASDDRAVGVGVEPVGEHLADATEERLGVRQLVELGVEHLVGVGERVDFLGRGELARQHELGTREGGARRRELHSGEREGRLISRHHVALRARRELRHEAREQLRLRAVGRENLAARVCNLCRGLRYEQGERAVGRLDRLRRVLRQDLHVAFGELGLAGEREPVGDADVAREPELVVTADAARENRPVHFPRERLLGGVASRGSVDAVARGRRIAAAARRSAPWTSGHGLTDIAATTQVRRRDRDACDPERSSNGSRVQVDLPATLCGGLVLFCFARKPSSERRRAL